MACDPRTCVAPSLNQAHCSVCHITFGGIRGFDRHRKDGRCRTPESLGMVDNGGGVWRAPARESEWWEQRQKASSPLPRNATGGPDNRSGIPH